MLFATGHNGNATTITTVLWVMLPSLLPRFPLPGVTLIVTAIVVPLMGYVVMPFLLRRFGGWVRR
jgi:antibiotic biosynthesis monooxygenase (ABM) superfamily enzyme